MPSKVLYGRFRGKSREVRICASPVGVVESVKHMIQCCLIYQDLHLAFLEVFFAKQEGWADANKIWFILLGPDGDLTAAKVASFLKWIVKRRRSRSTAIVNEHVMGLIFIYFFWWYRFYLCMCIFMPIKVWWTQNIMTVLSRSQQRSNPLHAVILWYGNIWKIAVNEEITLNRHIMQHMSWAGKNNSVIFCKKKSTFWSGECALKYGEGRGEHGSIPGWKKAEQEKGLFPPRRGWA